MCQDVPSVQGFQKCKAKAFSVLQLDQLQQLGMAAVMRHVMRYGKMSDVN
jgi:hypothetical protein